ncbi:MAG: MerR family transcriptional regulator [Candidatus Marinimicrobia bacterium CG08_land_8_20_14_0_20_45_22]|nr:MAG: MerR family transcriptional regulator [Candidatus Marinimicrobia bacterium CG08_land_8_20_14_0_20_45_22]
MNKPIKKLYYSIGEVSEITGLKQYVLRYWETEFSSLSPSKNRAGNRVYREKDIKVIQYIKHLLYDKKFTIEGAKQKLKQVKLEEMEITDEESYEINEASAIQDKDLPKLLSEVKKGLQEILGILDD